MMFISLMLCTDIVSRDLPGLRRIWYLKSFFFTTNIHLSIYQMFFFFSFFQLPNYPFVRAHHLQMILKGAEPAVDAGAVDSAGLTVLHRVSQALDLAYLALLLEERQKSQGELVRQWALYILPPPPPPAESCPNSV